MPAPTIPICFIVIPPHSDRMHAVGPNVIIRSGTFSSYCLTLRRRRLCRRFGGLQALQAAFFFRCCGGVASAAPEKGDSGEASPPQNPPPRKVSYDGRDFEKKK